MKTYKERTQSILQKAEKKKICAERRKKAIISGCACTAAVVFGFVLFVPYSTTPPSVEKYKNSEYYSLIRQLNEITYEKPVYKNNFEKWTSGLLDSLGDLFSGAKGYGNGVDYIEAPPQGDIYEETTNNQVLGVIEGDLLKRSDRYAYYLDGKETTDEEGGRSFAYYLRIYSIEGNISKDAGTVRIAPENGTSFRGYASAREMYLSEDCSRVTVVSPCYDLRTGRLYTTVIGVDVTSAEGARVTDRRYISGKYVSSRMKDGELLLISDFTVPRKPDFSDEAEYLPQTGEYGKMTSLPVDDIVRPDSAASANYTVLCLMNAETLEIESSKALLSYSEDVYVSRENIFVARGYTETYNQERYGLGCTYSLTEISCVSYFGNALDYVDSVVVEGSINDQYSMDEYEGILRVATTWTPRNLSYNTGENAAGEGKDFSEFDWNANLYCIDLEGFEIAGKVERFAPNGEVVRSARFDGETAYVCTSVRDMPFRPLTDPVYAFNVSEPSNITSKDTGTIDGYSLSLITFKDDTLLGIGYGEWKGDLKIELYREGADKVECVTKYEMESCEFSENFKAYFIDRERGLVGLGVESRSEGVGRYLLLRFDGYELKEEFSVDFAGNSDNMRAFYKDGYMYLFGDEEFKVVVVL